MVKQLDVIKIKRIDEDTITCDLMTILDDLSDFYAQIDCSTIDIVVRRFGGRLFDVICDDEALLRDEPGLPTSWWQSGGNKEGLFGTLLLCHNDGEGNLTDATPDDILKVRKAFRRVRTINGDTLTLLFHDIQ